MSYSDKLHKQHPHLLEVTHGPKAKFLEDLEKGTLPVDKFRQFIIQRYIIGRHFKKFIAILAAKFPQHFEHTTKQAAAEILGKVIANVKQEDKFAKWAKELKIAESEIQPTLVTKGFSDYLMMIAYNQGYKEALVIVVAMKMVYEKNKGIYGKGGDNPLFKEALQPPDQGVMDLFNWSEVTLNTVMKSSSEVIPKHASVLQYTLQWEAAILQAAADPQKWQWPVQL
jgi:thiaminase